LKALFNWGTRLEVDDSKQNTVLFGEQRMNIASLDSLDAALVEPREVFRPAIAAGAKFIMLVHNHPSGDYTPSDKNIHLTQKLCMCNKILGIEVIDYIITGFSDNVNLKDRELEAVEKPLFLNLPHSIFMPIIQMGLGVFMGAPLIFFLFLFLGGLDSVFHSYPLEIDSLR